MRNRTLRQQPSNSSLHRLRKHPKSSSWTLMPLMMRFTENRRGGSFVVTMTITAFCRCMCSVTTSCWLATCAPVRSTAPSTPGLNIRAVRWLKLITRKRTIRHSDPGNQPRFNKFTQQFININFQLLPADIVFITQRIHNTG